jgi:hypothetical protein
MKPPDSEIFGVGFMRPVDETFAVNYEYLDEVSALMIINLMLLSFSHSCARLYTI